MLIKYYTENFHYFILGIKPLEGYFSSTKIQFLTQNLVFYDNFINSNDLFPIDVNPIDGYSMADIQYKWGIDCGDQCKGAVGLAKNLELPQFKVKGHKQMQKVEILSTGKH